MSDESVRLAPDALDRARLGDRAAFAELYESLGGDVQRLCARLLGSAEEARDARNEVFLRAQAAFGHYDRRQPFRRWLLAVASHHCIDLLRRRQREGRLFESGELDETTLPAEGPSPLRATLQAEERARLLAAIEALPPRYRVPLVLRHFADLSYEAIGEALGLTPAQVGTLLFRARARLREQFRAGGGEP